MGIDPERAGYAAGITTSSEFYDVTSFTQGQPIYQAINLAKILPAGSVDCSPHNGLILGTKYSDIIYGNAGQDFLFGGSGEDNLYGGFGKDFLYGGADNDFINGAIGDDTADGGSGEDEYFYSLYSTDPSPVKTT
ncbi:MAG: calcium-binding protein, partial [Hyphomicrobiales bacterium]|nr:calcium-binding protein [Hyphomicrobiales bacterium]